MARRSVAVASGTRADYGLLRWLLQELRDRPDADLRLLVTGTHLSDEFGRTDDAIAADGFEIAARIPILEGGDTPGDVGRAMGRAVLGFVDALERIAPDLLVILGDRFEMLAAAQAAVVLRIPVAHLHGGEVTRGAIDDSLRHAITKLASLHFVSAEPYRRRVLQLGEPPERVFCVGAPGLENLVRLALPTRRELEQQLGLDWREPTFLVTHHPETTSERTPVDDARALCQALERFPQAGIIWTGSNADAGGRTLSEHARAFARDQKDRARFAESLGQAAYLAALRECDVVVGNSSSGIIEAPSLGTPTVNVGERQGGRLLAPSVLGCDPEPDAIAASINRALEPEFRARTAARENPYGSPGPIAARICRELLSAPLEALRRKSFHDLA